MSRITHNKPSVLVVDDEALIRVSMSKQLSVAGYQSKGVESAQAGLRELAAEHWDVVLSDLRMPGMSGLEFLNEVKQRFPHVDMILMTAYSSVESAVDALKQGAYDYITKPFRFEEIEVGLERIAEKNAREAEVRKLRELISENTESMGLVGNSAVMQRVREKIIAFAESSVPLLITGETGTGKEVVARAIHSHGRPPSSPFVAVGCGTIPREIAESELFGHERGAFSGAISKHIGAFERANTGTLLLDDVDDLPLDLQVKLLRVIQEGTLQRVGGETEISVDMRVIATSKVDLEAEAEAGRFRPDLFYRLRGLEIQLPPLRERGDDVYSLAKHFLELFAAKERRETKVLLPCAAKALKLFPWRGNVRELARAMESASIISRTDEVTVADLPEFLTSSPEVGAPFSLSLDQYDSIEMPELLHRFESDLLDWALSKAEGKQTVAARLLGLPRTTLQSKLHEREQKATP